MISLTSVSQVTLGSGSDQVSLAVLTTIKYMEDKSYQIQVAY